MVWCFVLFNKKKKSEQKRFAISAPKSRSKSKHSWTRTEVPIWIMICEPALKFWSKSNDLYTPKSASESNDSQYALKSRFESNDLRSEFPI